MDYNYADTLLQQNLFVRKWNIETSLVYYASIRERDKHQKTERPQREYEID